MVALTSGTNTVLTLAPGGGGEGKLVVSPKVVVVRAPGRRGAGSYCISIIFPGETNTRVRRVICKATRCLHSPLTVVLGELGFVIASVTLTPLIKVVTEVATGDPAGLFTIIVFPFRAM